MASILSGQLDQLSQLRIAVYTDVASLALLTYNWLLTFSDEVNMIWMSQAKLSKLLYFWIRYVGIVSQTLFATFFLVDGLPPVSLDPLPKVPQVVDVSDVSITISIVVLVKALSHTQPVSLPHGLPVTGCFSTVPDTIFEAIVTGIVTTSVLCILTIYRILRERNEMTASPLLSLFFRDGLMYYCCVNGRCIFMIIIINTDNITTPPLVVFMCNLFMLRFENAAFKILFNGLLNAVPCMLGARVLINILSLVRTNFGTDATTGPPLSEPKFARNGPRTFDSDEYTFDDGAAKATVSTLSTDGTLPDVAGIEHNLRSPGDVERGP
ncbi:hypothetical protein L226DRAFT_569266 [Lentinus tigrinus ALCF2SS1-7]|uniref:uncharacterized protein n=1 Tax=Lentinus tigrinus ALCF2SS1-7 TaxID=1328758 RepID=UPI001165F589|nr:hypothetical protein L226DRAFT_569266 [Lentinus tigrinus ALCF2SS1-7]